MLQRACRWLSCVGFCLLVTSGLSAAERPNVVLILADDMGYGDAGCYNSESRIPTPNIDRLARQGLRLTDAHAPASVCIPTRYGLLTGRYPFRSRRSERSESRIEPGRLTLGGFLQGLGYRTACVGKWHQGFEGGKARKDYSKPIPQGPVARGFDRFYGIPASLDIPPYYWIRDDRCVTPPTAMARDNFSPGWTRIQGAFWRAGPVAPDFRFEQVLPTVERQAVGFIDRWAPSSRGPGKKPFFLYVPLPAPHTPWLPSGEFRGKSGASMYGDFAMMVDATVGAIVRALEKHEVSDQTLVVFTSDNGPVWYPADTRRLKHNSVGPLRGMKGDAWEAGHRMPMIIRWPGRVPAGSTNGHLWCHTDFLATVSQITGGRLPRDAGEDSVGQWNIWRNPATTDPARRTLVTRSSGRVLAVRDGKWKYIPQLGSGGFSKPRRRKPRDGEPPVQLYDLSNDIGERKNLAGDRLDVLKRIRTVARRLTGATVP
jgi:arylsulfatase A-like enzyme